MRHTPTRTIHLALPVLVVLCLGGLKDSQAFEAIARPRLASADLDGDGRSEILAVGRLGPFQPRTSPVASRRARVEVYSETGTLFRLVATCEDIRVADDVAAADLDEDGRDEILVIGAGRLSVGALHGNQLQIRHTIKLPWERTHRVAAADVDGDGRPEVVVVAYDIAPEGGVGISTLAICTWTGAGLNILEEIQLRGHVGDLAFTRANGDAPMQLILERGGGDEGGEGIGYTMRGSKLVEMWHGPLMDRPIRVFHLSALPGSDLLAATAVDGSAAYLRSGANGLSRIRVERRIAPGAALLLARGDAGPCLITSGPRASGFGPALTLSPLIF